MSCIEINKEDVEKEEKEQKEEEKKEVEDDFDDWEEIGDKEIQSINEDEDDYDVEEYIENGFEIQEDYVDIKTAQNEGK